jgi:long-subunit fatty acid transport protein
LKRLITISVLFTSAKIVHAQDRPATSGWCAVYTPLNFSKHWQLHNDAGYRTLGTSAEPSQYLYRTGMRYNFNKQWSTAAGIAFFFTRTSFSKANDEFGHEFRLWQEMNYQHRINEKLQWQIRIRPEQRFFAATSTKTKYTGYRFRIRPGLTQKINEKWSIQLADEYMQQLAHRKFSFDQNRLMLSTLYHFNKTTQWQGGYMWLRWPKDNQHILTISFTKTISLYGKQ